MHLQKDVVLALASKEEIRGVIFDCDGTLIDTMPLYYEGWQLCCADLGLELSEEEFYSMGGMMVVDMFKMLISRAGLEGKLTVEDCQANKRAHQAKLEKPGRIAVICDLAVELKRHGKRLAVASSGWRDHVIGNLERVGLLELFQGDDFTEGNGHTYPDEHHLVVTGDEVAKAKPAPDIFLEAARRLGLPPSECIGFEDADFGVQSLEAAGIGEIVDVRDVEGYPLPECVLKMRTNCVA